MVGLRQYRTKVFREQVEDEWKEKYWKFIENNIDKSWNWGLLSSNPNITFDIVLDYPNKPWDWRQLSRNQNITFDMIQSHPEKPWNWGWLSSNPNITFDIVLAHPNKSWNWYGLSRNSNIAFDIVLAHPEKPWDWGGLSQNIFSKAKKNFVNKRYKEYLSAYRIQQYWNRAISIPANPICQRKIKRDYQTYVGGFCC